MNLVLLNRIRQSRTGSTTTFRSLDTSETVDLSRKWVFGSKLQVVNSIINLDDQVVQDPNRGHERSLSRLRVPPFSFGRLALLSF